MRHETYKNRDYRKIKAWQHADCLVKAIYKATKVFPHEERFGLVSQMRSAAVSAATNVVEGASRRHKKDYLRFLLIAKGSLSETSYLVGLSKDLGYLPEKDYVSIERLYHETASTLYGLIRAVEEDGASNFRSQVSGLPSRVSP